MTLNLPDVSANGSGLDARNQAALGRVNSGDYDAIQWVELTVEGNGHTGVFMVMALPLSMDGVFIGAGAGLAQHVADLLGAVLPTPYLFDRMYEHRVVTIDPFPLGTENMMSNGKFEQHTTLVRNALQKAGYSSGVVPIGKPFMLSNLLVAHPGKAINYGWYVPPGSPNPWRGVATYPSVSLSGVNVIQQPSWAHGLDQADYSEVVQLIGKMCTVDGQATDFATVAQDPILSALLSNEGPLKLLRQPGALELVTPPLVKKPKPVGGATVAMTVVGAGIGASIGGPVGAVIGGGIGLAVDAVRRRLIA